MIYTTIRRLGLIVPLVAFAMLSAAMLTAFTSAESAARTHKTGRTGKHGKIRHVALHARTSNRSHRARGKHYARLSRHRTPQRPLTTAEKAEIVQKIRTLATSTVGDATASQPTLLNSGDSIIAAEAHSGDVQSEIAEAAKEERAEDGVDSSLDRFLSSRTPHASAAPSSMSDALDPGAEVEREQDFTLTDESDPDHAAQRSDVMAEIINWIGTPYVFGGEDRSGIDCSSFTRQVFDKAFGLDLPRTAWMQSQMGDPVEKNDLQFGDLVFFKTARYAPITHVGIYIGDGLFANAACSRGVTVASIESEYWSKHYVGARRLLANNGLTFNGSARGSSPSSGAVAER